MVTPACRGGQRLQRLQAAPKQSDGRDFASAEAAFSFDAQLRIRAWNEPAEQLTGIAARDAVGRPCWQVLRGVGSDGEPFCHPGCSYARLLLEGRPPPSCEIVLETLGGPCPVSLSVIRIGSESTPVFLHLMRKVEAVQALAPEQARRLTPRQHEVAELLAQGLRAREIASHLGLAEITARNHIREIRNRLGCHSQLEVVAKLRGGRSPQQRS